MWFDLDTFSFIRMLPMQTFIDLFSLKDLIPHGYCLAWSPLLLWLSIISDALITGAYYLMPLIMIYFIRQRRDLLYTRLVLLIALFIVACGTTHLIHIITIWIPIYSLEILTKFLTAILSMITTVSMFYIVPKALSLPSTTQLKNEVTQRLIAEKALRESNNKLNTILDNIPAHIFVKDANCNYLYINKAVEDYFGIDKEHVIGRSSDVLFSDESARQKIQEQDQFVLETSKSTEYEIFENKQQHTFLTHKYPIINESNTTYALGVFALDITRIKNMTQQLQEKELMWKFAIDGSGDGVWDWNLQTNDAFYSPIWKEMLGYTQDELMPTIQTWHDLLHPQDKQKALATIQDYVEGKKPSYINEFRLRCKDDSYKWVLTRGMVINRDVEGKPLRLIGTHTDIDLRKQTEENLRLSNSMKRAVLKASPCAIMSISPLGYFNDYNPATLEMFVYSKDELASKDKTWLDSLIPKRLHEDERLVLTQYTDNAVGSLINYSFEFFGLRQNGQEFPIELTITPIHTEENNFYSLFIRDLTTFKQAEAALQQGLLEAEQANTVKSQFLAMMSHEIRTPLNAILGIQDLLVNTPLNVQQTEYVTIAAQAGTQLLRLVNEILDLTKVESGKLDLEQLDFDAVPMVEVCMQLFAIKAQEKSLALHTIIEPDLNTWIKGDPYRFRQLILNLVSNAIKFTEKGSVTIKLSKSSQTDDDCALLVEVIDTGIGIPGDLQAGLFEVFVQVDPSDTRKYGGSGLGLAISKRLVTLWGGQIGIDSTPSVGSRFWFTVGATVVAPEQPLLPTRNQDNNKVNCIARVLLVEDSLINQAVLAAMLRSAGHQVDLADCGTQGIEAASEKVYDIILMDVSMPDMSGMEATAIIRQLGGAAAKVPIIAITAHALAGYEAMCLAAGMNGYTTKPISQKDLLALVDTWCANPETQTTAIINPLVANSSALPLDEQEIHLDKTMLDELTAVLGQVQVKELVQIFLTELNTRCESIKQAIISQDLSVLSREGHTIKSTSATFGATALQAVGKELEACGYNDDLATALVVAERLLPCAEATMKMMSVSYS